MNRSSVSEYDAGANEGPHGDSRPVADDIVVVRSTVLIVEDNQRVLDMLSELLSGQYDVLEAADAEIALVMAAENPNLDIILSDVDLPGIDGPEMMVLLRAARPDLPVVFMSAIDEPAGISTPDRTEFLLKPFGPELLLDTLRTLLDDED